MEKAEALQFPEFYKNQLPYLAIRNLAISIFFSDPTVPLRKSNIMKQVLVPGLARIAYGFLCEDVINYLTQYGVINYGIFDEQPNTPLLTNLPKQSINKKIVIIGSGPSGISTACQLQRFGFKNVEILEARGRTG